MKDINNGDISNIKFVYGKKSKNIRGEFKADWENSRNISEVGIIDFDNIFWLKPKMEEIKEINTNKCEVEKMINEWWKNNWAYK